MLEQLQGLWRQWRHRQQMRRRLRRLGCFVDLSWISRKRHLFWDDWTVRVCDHCGNAVAIILWPERVRDFHPSRGFDYYQYCLTCGASAHCREENLFLLLEELESGKRPAIH